MADLEIATVSVAEDDEEATLHSRSSNVKAQDFLEERGGTLHPLFDVVKVTSPEQYSAPAPTFSQSTQRQTEEFLDMMESYRAISKDNSVRLLDLRKKHSWDDMVVAAEVAQTAYVNANPVRRKGRYVMTYSEAVQPYLRLIPNDFNLSVLYGGLRLVFEAFSQLEERRMKVLKAFLRIPNIIVVAEACVKNFPSDDLLYKRAEVVFCAALPAIEGTVRWLKQAPTTKHFQALILGPIYNRSFKEKLQNLDEALDELYERATILRDQSICRTEDAVNEVQNTLTRTDTRLLTVTEDLRNISRSYQETSAKVDDLRELEKIREEAQRAIKMVLQQKIETSEWMYTNNRTIARLKRQVEALARVESHLTSDDLLDIVNVRNSHTVQDCQQIKRAFQSAEIEQLDLVYGIIKGDRMSDWLHSDVASALFVEGCMSNSFDRNTPLSFLCAEMIELLRDKGPAVSVSYFCGSHTSTKDSLRGPTGIMRSLLAQVIHLYTPVLDFISKRYRQQLEGLHLHTLCDCFCRLVRKLPVDTVLFCIIDSISFFETKEWIGGLGEIMNQLQGLLDDDVNPVFKLLITSPVRSRYLGNAFPEACRLNISLDISENARSGPTEREIATIGTRSSRVSNARMTLRQSTMRKGVVRGKQNPIVTESEWDEDSFLATDMESDGADLAAEMSYAKLRDRGN